MRILVAEDESVSRMLLDHTLKRLGHEVAEAADGAQAWDLFQKEYFPLVITDWLMPALDGPALVRRVREGLYDKYTYVMMLTVLGGKESFLGAMEAGADDFITKPFDLDLLAARLRVADRILGLQAQVRTLAGLFPICCYCKKIRNDENFWEQVEDYISHQTGAVFSHGICPECYEKNARGSWKSAGI